MCGTELETRKQDLAAPPFRAQSFSLAMHVGHTLDIPPFPVSLYDTDPGRIRNCTLSGVQIVRVTELQKKQGSVSETVSSSSPEIHTPSWIVVISILTFICTPCENSVRLFARACRAPRSDAPTCFYCSLFYLKFAVGLTHTNCVGDRKKNILRNVGRNSKPVSPLCMRIG